MIRKLLFLLPLALLALNFTPYALYKDAVGLSGKPPILESLTPSHWRLLALNASLSTDVGSAASSNTKVTSVLSTGAIFRGFPFGAYFSASHTRSTADAQSSDQASAWSWLWASVDGLLVVTALLLAIRLNHPRPLRLDGAVAAAQPVITMGHSASVVAQPTATVPPAPTVSSQSQPQVITPQVITPDTAADNDNPPVPHVG